APPGSSLPKAASSDGFPCGEPMRACWAATLLVLVQPSPASCATCRRTSVVPRVLALTHRHLRKSPFVRQPFVEISGSISFSPLVFPFPEPVPNFVCHFKGSLQQPNWTRRFQVPLCAFGWFQEPGLYRSLALIHSFAKRFARRRTVAGSDLNG